MSEITHFQYCQKMVVINPETNSLLLAKRKGEADYDNTYALVGGKMETTDGGIVEGLRREKIEEIGARAIIMIAPELSYNIYFRKKDGNSMILPHYYAEYHGGEIELNSEEYSDYTWVHLDEVDNFEPKVETIPKTVRWARAMRKIISDDQLVKL